MEMDIDQYLESFKQYQRQFFPNEEINKMNKVQLFIDKKEALLYLAWL